MPKRVSEATARILLEMAIERQSHEIPKILNRSFSQQWLLHTTQIPRNSAAGLRMSSKRGMSWRYGVEVFLWIRGSIMRRLQ